MECAGPSQPSSQQDQGTHVITYKRKALATRPSPSCQKDKGGASKKAALREISEGSDEETEDDSRVCVDRHPQGNHAVDDDECGVEEDGVEEENSEREREREDREETMYDCEGGESQQYYEEDDGGDGENDHAYPIGDDDGRQERSTDVGVDDPTGERSEASVQKRKRQSSTSPTAAADKRAAKKLTAAASRQALKASQEAVAESMVDEGDCGEDAEGVPPRDVSEQTQPSADTRDEAIDTTWCFFLEFDEDGFAKKKREHIEVDVTKVLPIPEGDILFNHRTLDETLVQSIYDAIHHAAKETNEKWDFMTFILTPIVPNRDGSQGRRITPEQFDVELAHTYNWYVVAGQHTAEAMNRLIKDKSPAEKVYGLRSYSHVRVVYFDDDRKRGYPYVSTFDNTREERSIPRSFSSSVRQIKTFWDKRNGRIRPPGTVSPNDVEGMKRKKKWEEFMNAACKMTPDSDLLNSSLENDYCKDWTNKMRGYMNLAQCGETVWPLVQKFFDMYEKGLLPRVDGVRYIDLPGKVEGTLPGQYFLKDNSGKKVLFHYINARKGPPGATVSIPDLTPTIFKLFGDMTATEKQVALHHMMRGDVIVTSRSVPRGRCNMADLVKYTRRERYMVCMFNYILFKAEGSSKEEWSADFFIGYTTILERYNKNGLTDEKWTEERDRIPDDKARKVPRRLGGPDEINGENGAGLEATQGMYKETPFHLKCFIYEAIDCLDDLRAEVNRISSCACHIFWEVGKRITTILPFEIEPKGVLTDNEEVVGTARGMKIRATIIDMSTSPKCVPWDDDAFSKLYAFLMTCCSKRTLSCKDYAYLARKAGNFNNIDCDEDTSNSDLDVPSRAIRCSAQGARAEEPQGSTNADAKKARSSLGATHASEGDVEHRMNARGEKNGVPMNPVSASERIVNSRGNTGGGENGCEMTPPIAGPSSTHAPQAEQRTLTSMDIDEDEDMDMTVVMPKLVPGKPLPQGFAQDPSVPYLPQDKLNESSEEDCGHHILWHEGVFEPWVFAGK
ncbi:hypothetical protein CBR_g27997 [Chara braunii]|uniref:Uncharacterized protein n=1 Tax=Chara braunii TaxID=69332 RepID=A0A388L9A3_CHABU|nr:hypothetical protein CBR_g27997 [Chara braunii]|eukprot:GBG78773.1 hypothetical protein CBR_g27997 [Chara braunii]